MTVSVGTRCIALLLGMSLATPAEARRAGILEVQADPHYAAWEAALATSTGDADDCGTTESLSQAELERSRTREALLESLARRGFEPTPPPAGVAPWPWSSAPHSPQPAVVDTGAVSLLVDDGHIVYSNRYGQPEVDPARAARAFYAAHHDEYDFLVLFTNFYSQLGGGAYRAYHLAVANDVAGLGYDHWRFDETFSDVLNYTRKPVAGRLQSILHMNDINGYPDDPTAFFWRHNTPRSLLLHEVGHRWLARIFLRLPDEKDLAVLLGRSFTHWQFFHNTSGSAVEGNAWSPDGARFGTLDVEPGLGPLDLYLMGMLAPHEVQPGALWYLRQWTELAPPTDHNGNVWTQISAPTPGVSCAAEKREFTMDDVVYANGDRYPAYPDARRDFRIAYVMVVSNLESVTPQQLSRLQTLQQSFREHFHTQTLQRGSVDDHLVRVPARMVFVHRAHGDVEPAAQPTVIETRIELETWSLPTRLEDVRVTLSYQVDSGPPTALDMNSTSLGIFTAEIPTVPTGSRVRYWMRASSNFADHESLWPESGPAAPFEFSVRGDAEHPAVQHVPIRTWSRIAEPPLVRAVVRDAHGVRDVRVEYQLRGEAGWQSRALVVQGQSDVYETRLPLPGRIGDVVDYRIVATDVASTANVGVSPGSGTHALSLRREMLEDAEVDNPSWTHSSLAYEGPDEWHREVVNPRSGLWCWKAGPKNNTAPGVIAPSQDAVLVSPKIHVYPGARLTFWHRYSFLLEEMDPWRYAIDGGAVEWQDAERDGPIDRWYQMDPDEGYTHWISHESDSPLISRQVFAGYEPFWRQETCSLGNQPWILNRNIRIRFRVATSSPQYRRPALDGWLIDDIALDPGPPPTAIQLEDLSAARTRAGIELHWRARDAEPGDAFRVYRAALEVAELRFDLQSTLAAEPGQRDYAFVDAETRADRAYAYRIGLVTGGRETTGPAVEVAPAARFALHANVPNPFNPSTQIDFELAVPGVARLALYDVRGRHVRDLVHESLDAGFHRRIWDGTDARGRRVGSGLYFYRLTSSGRETTRRMLLLQ